MAKTLKISVKSGSTIGDLLDEIFEKNLNQFQLLHGRGLSSPFSSGYIKATEYPWLMPRIILKISILDLRKKCATLLNRSNRQPLLALGYPPSSNQNLPRAGRKCRGHDISQSRLGPGISNPSR